MTLLPTTNIHPDRLPLPLRELKAGAPQVAMLINQHAMALIWLGQFFFTLRTLEGAAALAGFIATQLRGQRGFSRANLDLYLALGRHGLLLQDGAGSHFGLRLLKQAALFSDERRQDLLVYGRGEERHPCAVLERVCRASRGAEDPAAGRVLLLQGLYGGGEPQPRVMTREARLVQVEKAMGRLRQVLADALASEAFPEGGRGHLLRLASDATYREALEWLAQGREAPQEETEEVRERRAPQDSAEEARERRTQARPRGGEERGAARQDDGDLDADLTGEAPPQRRRTDDDLDDVDLGDLTGKARWHAQGTDDQEPELRSSQIEDPAPVVVSASNPSPVDRPRANGSSGSPVGARLDDLTDKAPPTEDPDLGLTGEAPPAAEPDQDLTGKAPPAADPDLDDPDDLDDDLDTTAADLPQPAASSLRRVARPPLRRDQVALPVGAPRRLPDPTPLELKLCALIMGADTALCAVDAFLALRYPLCLCAVKSRLAFCYIDAVDDYRPACDALLRSLDRLITAGQPEVSAMEQALRAADPTWGAPRGPIKPLTPIEALRPYLPACSVPSQIDTPVGWVVFSLGDPTHGGATANEGEGLLWQILGLLPVLLELLAQARALSDAGGDAAPLLCAQADMTLRELRCGLSQVRSDLWPQVEEGRREAEAEAEARAQRRAELDTAQVTLGCAEVGGQSLTLGRDDAGRYLTITADQPTLTIIMGSTGWGKTYALRVIAEAAALTPAGLVQLRHPQLVIQMETDYHNGQGRRQMLSGYGPNPYLEQLAHLREHYDVRRDTNEAYTNGLLLAFPEALPALRAQYPDLMERGLHIAAARVHPAEVGNLGYRSLFAYAIGGLGSAAPKATWVGRLESLITDLGDQATPARLLREIAKIKSIDPRPRDALNAQLRQLVKLIVPTRRLSDHLKTQRPVFVLLETRYRSPDVVLPYQVVLLHAFTQRFGDDPFRWILIDEVSKLMEHPVIAAYILKLAQELRHRPVSLVMNGQRVSNLPPALFGLASVCALFHIDSPWEFKKLQEQCALFRDVSFEEARALTTGQCLLGAVRATHPAYEQRARPMAFRPTLTCAGGETLRAR